MFYLSARQPPMKGNTMKNRTRAALAVAGAGVLLSPLAWCSNEAYAESNAEVSCTSNTSQTTIECRVSGTTDQPTVTFPLTASEGVSWPTGVFPMQSGAGSMTVTENSVTFAFNDEYLAEHDAPYSFSGYFGAKIDSYNVEGPFELVVAGKTHTFTPEGYCDEACRDKVRQTSGKNAWDNGDGSVGSEIVFGAKDNTVAGRQVTITDLVGPGQYDCVGYLNVQNPDGSWQYVRKAIWDASAAQLSVQFNADGASAYRLNTRCMVDGTQDAYTDTGYINGAQFKASTTAVWGGADGNGNTKPTPTPTPTDEPTPEPEETPTWTPSPDPSETPTPEPQPEESPSEPSTQPSESPEATPTPFPTPSEEVTPVPEPTPDPSTTPTSTPTPDDEVTSDPTPSSSPESTPSEATSPTPSAPSVAVTPTDAATPPVTPSPGTTSTPTASKPLPGAPAEAAGLAPAPDLHRPAGLPKTGDGEATPRSAGIAFAGLVSFLVILFAAASVSPRGRK